jgi:HNH endonuclease
MLDSVMNLKAKLLGNIVKEPGPLDTPCWIWTGTIGSEGYGQTPSPLFGDRYAHRVAYRLFVGPIPDGLYICHDCDNPVCVNPDHLYVGTAQENVADMWARGRANPTGAPGSRNGSARLSETDVQDIIQALSEGESQQVIADERGVSSFAIRRIARGKGWTHVAGPRPAKRNKSSRFIGVSRQYDDKGNVKWQAYVCLAGKRQHLGLFCFEVDAAIAYNTHAAYLGLDKPLNQIPDGEWCHD